jgi:hypothetical protein
MTFLLLSPADGGTQQQEFSFLNFRRQPVGLFAVAIDWFESDEVSPATDSNASGNLSR